LLIATVSSTATSGKKGSNPALVTDWKKKARIGENSSQHNPVNQRKEVTPKVPPPGKGLFEDDEENGEVLPSSRGSSSNRWNKVRAR
jgi:hypothetical protein